MPFLTQRTRKTLADTTQKMRGALTKRPNLTQNNQATLCAIPWPSAITKTRHCGHIADYAVEIRYRCSRNRE
ncbi:hypothetical protein HZ326_17318 [Fusarium oxysporum f. sp. albedinis]|nr:hypothetical protein HZ326_17318 [Fusarium oxysporum f. sp. albedinis]